MEEKDLITQLQSPKTRNQAFERLLDQYQRQVYWLIRRIVLSHEDADDILQDTFIKIYENISSFRGESSLYSWIYRIATNKALDFLRKKAQKKHISIEELQLENSLALEQDPLYHGDALSLQLQKAVAQLPEKQRIIFTMKYFQEMKYSEIAIILHTSEGALKASYHHAVQKIKKMLEIE